MFTIQQTSREVMVWCKAYDGRKICVYVCEHRFQADLWIEMALRKQKA